MVKKQATKFRLSKVSLRKTYKQHTSFGGIKGQDGNTLSQLQGVNVAEKKVNYFQNGEGKVESRGGARKIAEIAAVSLLEDGIWWYGNIFLVATGKILYAVDKTTGTSTIIKNDFTNDITGLVPYGNHAFVASGYRGNKIFRISVAIAYDGQTANFTVNKILTDATSGATARILADTDSGATGVLTIGDIDGTFGNNNIITDNNTVPGSATANGTIYFTATEVADSEPGDKLFIKTSDGGATPGSRLLVTRAGGNKKRCTFTAVDQNELIPWNTAADWDVAPTTASPETAGYVVIPRDIETITSRGDYFVIGSKSSRTPFDITSVALGTEQVIDIKIGWEYKDHGLVAGLDTSSGTYYLEKGGLRVLLSTTKDNLLSGGLGNNYFDDVTLDKAKLIHDTKHNIIFATYAKNSTTNNETLAYNINTGAITIIEGWNLNGFIKDDDNVYGISSISGKLFRLLDGFTDDSRAIYTELTQNLTGTTIAHTSVLRELEVQAILFEGEELFVHIDIEEIGGGFVTDAFVYKIVGQAPTSQLQSWGSAGYGSAGWGSGSGGSKQLSRKYHTDDVNIEFISAKIRLTSALKTPSVINIISAKIETGNPINLNNIE
ncbi:MAG: hypothetical protein WCY05_06485 [Candidatus Omnitrophota bacterium]